MIHDQREENLQRLKELFEEFTISILADIDELLKLSAVNVTGINMKTQETYDSKYVQVIGVEYIPDRKPSRKNINLKYFGKSDNLSCEQKCRIIEFVSRYRLEKSYRDIESNVACLTKAVTCQSSCTEVPCEQEE